MWVCASQPDVLAPPELGVRPGSGRVDYRGWSRSGRAGPGPPLRARGGGAGTHPTKALESGWSHHRTRACAREFWVFANVKHDADRERVTALIGQGNMAFKGIQ